ncbi:hypothetical protein M427DRAFT_353402 [Gonapodya prolifera JEL478]|uniref:Uncharacterized protein n=1 Tax=Gonapodya prolifera (strain JEL478) TaxID=1344416 RepID=A0A139AD19_GONPJ|nr:hypothetical protein M427DRAFT_353402 [Gonapodya prolifera JEL478]|eukprot:KXS14313.1 hypothetical protein M427DRAFT_353402 [Gonapodya prolifera JEL478]
MMEGINKTYSEIMHTNEPFFSAAFFIGYHTHASNSQGVLSHTFNSALFSDVRVNGIPASEAFVNALIAAQYGVPVVLLTGDQALKDEVRSYARECGVFRRGKDGSVECAIVKESVGRTSVHTSEPS